MQFRERERVKKKKVCSSFRFFFHRLCKLFKVLPKSRLGFSLLFFLHFFYCAQKIFALRRKWKMPLELLARIASEFRANKKKVFFSLSLSLVITQNTRVCDDKLASKHQNLHFKKKRECLLQL